MNVAARIEQHTRVLGHTILLSASVASALAETNGLISLGSQKLPGHAPIELLTLVPVT